MDNLREQINIHILRLRAARRLASLQIRCAQLRLEQWRIERFVERELSLLEVEP